MPGGDLGCLLSRGEDMPNLRSPSLPATSPIRDQPRFVPLVEAFLAGGAGDAQQSRKYATGTFTYRLEIVGIA